MQYGVINQDDIVILDGSDFAQGDNTVLSAFDKSILIQGS